MTVHVKELVIRDWTAGQIDLYRGKGDFSNLVGLLPALDTPGRLKRAPDWSSLITWPAGFDNCVGIFYDQANDRFVFLGQDTDDALGSCYVAAGTWTMVGPYTLGQELVCATLGGLRHRNYVWHDGVLYVIGDTGDVWSGATYTGALAQFDADLVFTCLATYGDRLYAARTDGAIERLNDAGNAFEAHWTPAHDAMTIDFMTGYRGYLYAIASDDEGNRLVLQIDSAEAASPSFQVMAQLGDCGVESIEGCAYVQHGNYLYFIPGVLSTPSGSGEEAYAPLYRYRFSSAGRLDLVTSIPCDAADYFYLLPWRGHLLCARFYGDDDTTYYFKLIHPEGHSDAIPITLDASGIKVIAKSTHGHIVVTAKDTSQGMFHTGSDSGLQDGYLETSRLDMGHPGKEKRLDRITVILDGATTNFKIPVKYRVDDETSWTTATTGNNTRRVSIGDLGVSFYTLQLRIDLDDDTGADTDHRINAVSVIYTIDD